MRIAAINCLNLGDNLVFLPVVQGIASALPNSEIKVFTNEMAAQAYDEKRFDVSIIRRARDRHVSFVKRPLESAAFVAQLRAFRPDVVILGHTQPNFTHLASFLAGAPIRVGGSHDRIKGNWLTHSIELNTIEPMPLQNWRLLQSFTSALRLPPPPSLPPRPNLQHLISADFNRSSTIVIHTGASQAYRRWPRERFLELAQRLSSQFSVVVIDEESQCCSPYEAFSVKQAGSLRELVDIIHGAMLFIGNNSGPMHVALSLGTPTMIFSGPTHRIWYPFWGSYNRILVREELACIRCEPYLMALNKCTNLTEPMACMHRWSVETAYAECLSHIDKINACKGSHLIITQCDPNS